MKKLLKVLPLVAALLFSINAQAGIKVKVCEGTGSEYYKIKIPFTKDFYIQKYDAENHDKIEIEIEIF